MSETVCAECREMLNSRPWLLSSLSHPICLAAIRAERQAARKFWVRYDPKGHAEGSIIAGRVGLLAEDAHKQFTPKVRDRRREAAEGYTHVLLTSDEWDTKARPCLLGECGHYPAPTATPTEVAA